MKNSCTSVVVAVAVLLLSFHGSVAYAVENSSTVLFHEPLVDAANQGNISLVNALLNQGESPNAKGDFDATALMRASFQGNKEIVNRLLLQGADVNRQDLGGATALHIATRQNRPEIMKMLLKHQASVDLQDKEGWTPLMRAAAMGNKALASILLNAGAKLAPVNEWGDGAILYAVQSGNLELVSFFLDQPGLSSSDPQLITAKAMAEQYKKAEMIALFEKKMHAGAISTTDVVKEILPWANPVPSIEELSTLDPVKKETASPLSAPEVLSQPTDEVLPWRNDKEPLAITPHLVTAAPEVETNIKPEQTAPAEVGSTLPLPAPLESQPATNKPVWILWGEFKTEAEATKFIQENTPRYKALKGKYIRILRHEGIYSGQAVMVQIGAFANKTEAEEACMELFNTTKCATIEDMP